MADTSILQMCLGAGVSMASHPITYAKVLIQIGHEPIAPMSSTTLFGRPALVYPNIFKYMGHIRKSDGFFGMYRGLTHRLLAGIIGSSVNSNVTKCLTEKIMSKDSNEKEIDEDNENLEELIKMLKKTSIEMTARCTAMVVSHPFHVVMVRSMAQFVGKETKYSSFFGSFFEVYRHDGILGYFAGLVPRLLGEALTVWLTNVLIHIMNQYVISDELSGIKGYSSAVCTLLVSQITYPFSMVSNVMAVCGSGLAAGSFPNMPEYYDWSQCMNSLIKEGQIKRGSSMFFRYYRGNTVYRHDNKPIQTAGAFAPPALS